MAKRSIVGLKKLSREHYLILDKLDVDAAMKNADVLGYRTPDRHIALAGLHKARIMAGWVFTQAQREQSRRWLRANGFEVPGEPKGQSVLLKS